MEKSSGTENKCACVNERMLLRVIGLDQIGLGAAFGTDVT